jgi:signal transduction histidine kinase
VSRQRLLIVVTPALVVGVIEALSDTLLDPVLPFPGDALLIAVAVLAFSAALSGIAFRRIDALGATVAARNRELENRAAAAAGLHRVSVAIAALVDLRQILDAIVDNARTLLESDVAILLLVDPDGGLRHAASRGPADGIDPNGRLSALGEGGIRQFVTADLLVSRLETPLQRGSETIGVLAIGTRRARSFDVDAVETLASLANQAAIAIENARLQGRLRELAVENERERIAREMHDGLAQVLGYVNTKSQAVEELLAHGRVADARGQLGELGSAARSLYVDVREAILGLRSPIGGEVGLARAIDEYATRFAEASKLGVAVEISAAARAASLPPESEAHVFRILQESLTNVRKHAAAARVVVALDRIGDELRLEVRDDGRGFAAAAVVGMPDGARAPVRHQPALQELETPVEVAAAGPAAAWPHYGIAAMRERAAQIGARIYWSNGSQGGGVVRLDVPVTTARAEVGS